MKFAFSTLSYPQMPWHELVDTAHKLGYASMDIDKPEHLTAENMALLDKYAMSVSCLATSCVFSDPDEFSSQIQQLKTCVELADQYQIPYLKIAGDANQEPDEDLDIAYVAENLMELSKFINDKDVTVLLDSNGVFSDSCLLEELLDVISQSKLGIYWNSHNTYRFCLEPAKETYESVEKYLKYVHVQDSLISDTGDIKFKMIGEGDIPLKNVFKVLHNSGYQGYLSFSHPPTEKIPDLIAYYQEQIK